MVSGEGGGDVRRIAFASVPGNGHQQGSDEQIIDIARASLLRGLVHREIEAFQCDTQWQSIRYGFVTRILGTEGPIRFS